MEKDSTAKTSEKRSHGRMTLRTIATTFNLLLVVWKFGAFFASA